MNDAPRRLPSPSNAISSISAMPMPSARPPCTCPSTIIGLIRTPQSSTAMNRRTLTCAGARVDVDDADVGAVRVGEVRRVVDARGVEVALDAVGQLAGRQCAASAISRDRDARARVAARREQRPFSHTRSSGRDLEHRRGDQARLVAHLAGDQRRPPPRRPGWSGSRRCPGRTGSGRCRRARPRCRRAGCRAPRRRSARTSSRGPGPAICTTPAARPCRWGARAARRRRPCRGRGCPCACAVRRRRPR